MTSNLKGLHAVDLGQGLVAAYMPWCVWQVKLMATARLHPLKVMMRMCLLGIGEACKGSYKFSEWDCQY